MSLSEVNLPDINKLLDSAQKMQEDMQRIQQGLANKSVEGSSGGGLVKCKMNGRYQVLRIEIDPSLVQGEDLQMLQDLIVASVNQASARVTDLVQQELADLGVPFQVPGLV